jgi:ribosomal-protein-serine acetyltransferase
MFQRVVAEGIEIRQFSAKEADVVFAMVERNREYLRQWLPWVNESHSADDVRHFIERANTQWEAGLGPSCGIWLDGVFSGSVGSHAFDRANRSCSIGYWIEAGQQGKGIITRCCRSLIDYLFHEAGLHRVEICCGTGNVRSNAIPRRLGFSLAGVVREAQWVNGRWVDLEVWSMLEQNWRNPPTAEG